MDTDSVLSSVSSALPTPFSVKNILNLTDQVSCSLDFQQSTIAMNYQCTATGHGISSTHGNYGHHHGHHHHAHLSHASHHLGHQHPMSMSDTPSSMGLLGGIGQPSVLHQLQESISNVNVSSCEYAGANSLLHPGGHNPQNTSPGYSPYNDLTAGALTRLSADLGMAVGAGDAEGGGGGGGGDSASPVNAPANSHRNPSPLHTGFPAREDHSHSDKSKHNSRSQISIILYECICRILSKKALIRRYVVTNQS